MDQNTDLPNQQQQQAFLKGIQESPHLYANGFMIALGEGDVLLLLQRNGQVVANLNVSFTVAKTLAKVLNETVSQWEKSTGSTILTTHQVKEAVHKK